VEQKIMTLHLKGIVYICGAGPGDPDLLTVKTAELVHSCDVVLYDRLVSDDIIAKIPKSAEKIFVGRNIGDPLTHQDNTNQLMALHAGQGKRVLRLKGGDPMIFGRGGEEAEYLAERGIDFEIVPGVSSAIASPTYAGIPLTHRQYASSVAIVTGHEQGEMDPDPSATSYRKDNPSVKWDKLAVAADTIVILMGMEKLGKISASLVGSGLDADTPVAIVENGTTPRQRILTGKLGSIAAKAAESAFKSPAVIVIGKVVSLQKKLDWFPNRTQGRHDKSINKNKKMTGQKFRNKTKARPRRKSSQK
jgi:uroporphyrin-III C-methyltransferase